MSRVRRPPKGRAPKGRQREVDLKKGMTIEELLDSLSEAERVGGKAPQIETSRPRRRRSSSSGAPVKSFEDFAAAAVLDSVLEDPEIPLPPG